MNSIIDVDGNNNYKLEHMNKARLEREGLLPRSIVARPLHHLFLDANHDENNQNEQNLM
jgi:hypothetical protein